MRTSKKFILAALFLGGFAAVASAQTQTADQTRSEEHTSELQSLV